MTALEKFIRRPDKLALLYVSVAAFMVVLGASVALLARIDVPNYGTWTGIQPLETKLKMLEQFSAAGDVDALVIGSSIVDFGFSAELFSELMSRESGRNYRAFNFSTGGAEPRTLPKLYRFAQTVSTPKNVYVIVPPEPKLAEHIYEGSPDHTLRAAPVGDVINHPWLLAAVRYFWTKTFLQNVPAARDYLLFGNFRNLQSAVGMEAYAVNDHGDRISYLMMWKNADLPDLKLQNEAVLSSFPEQGPDNPAKVQRMADFYFARTDISAMEELRELVKADGGRLHLVAHAGAATLWGGPSTNAQYRQASRDFFKPAAAKLGAKFYDPTDAVSIPSHGVSDGTHLNTHGARIFTRAAFATIAGKPVVTTAEDMLPPPAGLFPTTNTSFGVYSALLRRPANVAHPLLRFTTVESPAVPQLPAGELFVALRTPQNTDIVVSAVRLGPSDFVAEIKLPAASQPEALVLRLLEQQGVHKVALSNPLATYEWITGYPQLKPTPVSRAGAMQVLALPPKRAAGDDLYIAFKSRAVLPPLFTIRLASQAPLVAGTVDLGKAVPPQEGLVKVTLPVGLAPGSYTVRIHDAASDVQLGQSQTVQLAAPVPGLQVATAQIQVARGSTATHTLDAATPLEPRLEVEPSPSTANEVVKASWSGIATPSPQDWIGLFPADGSSESRLEYAFLLGKPAGQMGLRISPATLQRVSVGEFELRLFAAGGWSMLARSARFKFTSETTPVAGK